ncbi:CYFA0S10e01354g1_1 [Cyberlindnera fabianii]|uniref:Alpha-1,2-galactosyltransferase n=1 Tax=Cyberlindnera fabianii TaxID=36022 RepID=A0A061AYS8_CYBFA|nr:Alpha-1,2-galactosyltransferase [Cyberlindnera fabianii]CDR42706.1 CYFA0S10e01354g1_1 [Cyberlindnera fabianii]
MVYVDKDIESNLKDQKSRFSTGSRTNKIIQVLNHHKKIVFGLLTLLFLSLFTSIPLVPHFKLTGPKVVIILAANEGGGVLKWKGAQEWSIERSSIANKRDYARRHGYGLAIKDMTMKKRYSHEWRESWEKVDILKQTFRQYPNAEWFWWLDLHTYIMEPQISLEDHIFNRMDNITTRQLTDFNPLKLKTDAPFVDYNKPVELLITQDCGGFNLGSFLIHKSKWSEALLDIWWDPVFYEQMHMAWEHKEQDALETLYNAHPWIRESTAFLPLRSINAFPPGACSEQANDPRYFYNERERDFVVNMAGCDWGRDCWNEMEYYKALSKKLQKPWYKFW